MRTFLIFSLIMLGALYSTQAQKRESKKDEKKEQKENSFSPFNEDDFPQTEQPTDKKSKKHKITFRQAYKNGLDRKKEEFYDRLKKNAKEDRKMAKKMEKPQYSDPMYFGHKHKPKKRPVGKRKYCKECGMIH